MYAIIRAKKHKSFAAIARSARHNFREQPTLNADSSRGGENRFLGRRGSKALLRALLGRLPIKRRKDAVLCIEYLITASPEAFNRHGGHLDDLGSGYFADALEWLRVRHGKENVISAAVHLDETTPHLVVYVVPLTQDGRLSARDFLGGPKVMRALQDSFYAACGQPHNLLRGIQGAKAHHTDIKHFYAALGGPSPDETLSVLDYAAKALGYETEAWKLANSYAKRLAQQATMDALQRKALHSRTQALTLAEEQMRLDAARVQKNAKKQAKRELSLEHRERELAKREPELEIAFARAEAAERLLDLNQQRGNDKPALSRRKVLTPNNSL
ncbi:MobV family relaxase [Pseudomonas aeruginosa]